MMMYSTAGHPTECQKLDLKNPRWRTDAILKILKLLYLRTRQKVIAIKFCTVMCTMTHCTTQPINSQN